MKRREIIAAIAGAAGWPLAARAQQSERIRRIVVLMALAESDDTRAHIAKFRQELEKLGWSEGHNVRIAVRFAAGRTDQFQELAKELVNLQPDVILAQSPPIAAAFQRESRAIPIVFVSVSDPVGSGFVANLAKPGGNLTGLLQFEAGITGKWLAMLKEIAPRLARAALVANPKTTATNYFVAAAKVAAASLAIELAPYQVETAADIERVIEFVGRVPNSGLLLPPDTTTIVHRDIIISLTAQHRLPTVYPGRGFVAAGGLMSYGTDQVEIFRQAASYVDRILRGATPADLPVQAPTKFETAINLKTAKALGLPVPPGLLVAADEVFE